MRRILLTVLVLFSLAAGMCDRPPGDLVPPETLVPMLIDFHLTYAIQSSTEFNEISRKVDSVDAFSYLFSKHGVSREDFDSTIAWYSRNPEHFTEIYDQVVMQLTRLMDSIAPDWD